MDYLRALASMAKQTFITRIIFITFLLHATHATAGVIYDEAVNGDLSGFTPSSGISALNTGTAVGALSNGSNLILGSSFFQKDDPRSGTPFTWERDHFTFSLSDTATVAFQYTVTDLIQTNSAVGVDFRIWDETGTGSPANPGFITPLVNGSYNYIPAITLSAGTYLMYAEAASLGFAGSGRVGWNYSWDLTVAGLPANVPEPTSLLLVILGIISIGVSRKNQWRINGVRLD